MKPITCLVFAIIAVLFAFPAHAQVDCAIWNTQAFFNAVKPSDITRCLQAGAQLEERDQYGWTPLHWAASCEDVEPVMALLEAGANTNAQTDDGETPLHAAALFGSADVVMALLNAGSYLESRTTNGGETPLHVAARNGHADVVTVLTAAGANLEARDSLGETPLHKAELRKRRHAFSNGELSRKRYRSFDRVVTELIEAGADYSVISQVPDADFLSPPAVSQGDCALWATEWFIQIAKPSDVTRCLQAGADLEGKDRTGRTTLHQAARVGSAKLAAALLNAGADPNARDIICTTPLHYAAGHWNAEVGLVLLAGGADPMARNDEGKLPFDSVLPSIGDILRSQAEGRIPTPTRTKGGIGGPLQTDFYRKLLQARVNQRFRPWTANPVPPACREDGELWHLPDRVRRKRN